MTPPTAPSARTIFIGDVHGMLTELDELLLQLGLNDHDQLIFMGDLVDKGPDQLGVVRRVGELQRKRKTKTLVVRGNHEDKHIRFRKRLLDSPKVAAEMAERYPTLVRFHTGATDEDWQVLLDAVHFWRCTERNILAVHGGIPGNLHHIPENWDDVPTLDRSHQKALQAICRTRFIDPETGKFIANDHVTPDHVFWASVYDGRFGHVIFGHQPFLEGIARFPHATGIDTGAVHGGHLSALVLDMDGHAEICSVPGKKYSTRHTED